MPTIGQDESLVRFVRADFFSLASRGGWRVLLGLFALPLLARVAVRCFAFRFEAMGVFYVNCVSAPHKR